MLAGYDTHPEVERNSAAMDAEFQAHYVAAVAQALMRVEETEMDLMNIRKQVKISRNSPLGRMTYDGGEYALPEPMAVDSEDLMPSTSASQQLQSNMA